MMSATTIGMMVRFSVFHTSRSVGLNARTINSILYTTSNRCGKYFEIDFIERSVA